MQICEIIKDCYCEGYLHEKISHYREGIEEKKLHKGDRCRLIEEWSNCYGNYLRVEHDGKTYDILPQNIVKL